MAGMSGSRDEPSEPPAAGEPTFADPDQQHTINALGPQLRRARDELRRDTAPPPPPRDEPALQGMRVGRYQLLEMVGAGGMGMVWGAWDPELERRVALKLMQVSGAASRERMLSEGQALAKLSHPNVVPIYDVGVMGEQVYLVMEWVRGATLRSFARKAPSARALLEAYRQAGEGLTAAHRAGIIHRDFKPDNVIRGDDGRVRVLDFGLAQSEVQPGTLPPSEAPDDDGDDGGAHGPHSRPTAQGERRAIIGTPRYMAPEQKRGDAATPATDQYAFCVAIAEALGELASAQRGKVPSWITAITARGMAPRPEQRYPSMQALLEALARDPRTLWRRRAAALAVAASAVAAFAVGRTRAQHAAVEPCAGSTEEIAQAWTAPTRAAMTTHLRELGVLGESEIGRIGEELDAYRDRWTSEHRRTCMARERKELTPTLYERRLTCLARAKSSLAAVASLLTSVPQDGLAGALVARRGLPAASACAAADDSAVIPPSPEAAVQLAALTPELERARVLGLAQRPETLELARSLVIRARAIGYAPLTARALLVQATSEFTALDRPGAIKSLSEALALALSAFDDVVALEAYARRFWMDKFRDPPEDWNVMWLLAARAGARGRFGRALMLNNRGSRYFQEKLHDQARQMFEAALAQTELGSRPLSADASDEDIELLAIPKNLALIEKDAPKRIALMERLLSSLELTLGQSHPKVESAREQLAMLTPNPERAQQLLAQACAGYERWHMTRGVTICSYEAGWLADELGDREAAVRWMRVASRYQSTAKGAREKGNLAAAYVAMYDPAATVRPTPAELLRIAKVAEGRSDWANRIDEADAYDLAARAFISRGDTRGVRQARAAAVRVLGGIDEPTYERRVARARAELAVLTTDVAEARRLAARYQLRASAAGGYEKDVARLEALPAAP